MITIDLPEIQIYGFMLNPRISNTVIHLPVLPLLSSIMQIFDPSHSQVLSIKELSLMEFKNQSRKKSQYKDSLFIKGRILNPRNIDILTHIRL